MSGSGKSTLVRDVLAAKPLQESWLRARLRTPKFTPSLQLRRKAEARPPRHSSSRVGSFDDRSSALEGWEGLGRVVAVDQSLLGRTPRPNPAVYIGAFDEIRELFARTADAGQRGLNASAFSFNSVQGQCERCRGAGFEKIEMQFLSDIFVRCPDCNGRRYRPHILEIMAEASAGGAQFGVLPICWKRRWMKPSNSSRAALAIRATRPEQRPVLKLLQESRIGLRRLGQPINTLSGGESQRLKLVSHRRQAAQRSEDGSDAARIGRKEKVEPSKQTFFIFDEPTTGLHFDDVRVLLKVFQRLVKAGHSVLVIEHNLDVIKSADWIIDLGPEGGEEGGEVVVQGTPEEVAACAAKSYRERLLGGVLFTRSNATRGSCHGNVNCLADKGRKKGGGGRNLKATLRQIAFSVA